VLLPPPRSIATAPNRRLPLIAVDATLWDEPTTGIGLYTRSLVGGLKSRNFPVARLGARRSGEHPRGLGVGRTAFTLGVLPQLLRQVPASLFHAFGNFNLPLSAVPGKKLVLTLHDLIPELLPVTVSASFRWQFRIWLRRSVQLADHVICVSAATRTALLSRYPEADPARVSVVHLGVDHVDAVRRPDDTAQAFLRALGLPERYALYAGSLDARKNVEGVIYACARLGDGGTPVPLVLVGQSWFGSRAVEDKILALRARGVDLRPLGYQPEPLFYELMRRASLFLFPSRYEGFGLPPLEAMRLGVPVIISSAGALPEVCGDAALQVRWDDSEALAGAILHLWQSESERLRRAEAGKKRAAEFTWRRAAEQTAEIYARLLA
jgi:glycosyltransferase involved in cell wall biosynthesis